LLMEMNCPYCLSELTVDENMIGKKCRCLNCNRAFFLAKEMTNAFNPDESFSERRKKFRELKDKENKIAKVVFLIIASLFAIITIAVYYADSATGLD